MIGTLGPPDCQGKTEQDACGRRGWGEGASGRLRSRSLTVPQPLDEDTTIVILMDILLAGCWMLLFKYSEQLL